MGDAMWIDSLRAWVDRYVAPRTGGSLSVGVEHEFFLMRDVRPVTHLESQAFLQLLLDQHGYRAQVRTEDELGPMLSELRASEPGGRYTALKYDHHPHLLEIAFGHHQRLDVLALVVEQRLKELDRVADQLGLRVAHQPVLSLSASTKELMSELQPFVRLRHYRRLLLAAKDVQDDDASNYAAVIAATQTHIGGVDWWARPERVNFLLSLEPDLLGLAGPTFDLTSRWSGYARVFVDCPLVGFPRIPRWTQEEWLRALVNSPLAGGIDEPWAAQTLSSFGSFPDDSIDHFWRDVRALEIVRPRTFGTLEFRADPAQPDAEHIIAIAAARLAAALLAIEAEDDGGDLAPHRARWWGVVEGKIAQRPLPLAKLVAALERRGLGEEKYLSCLARFTDQKTTCR